tara:strand:+ start:211 stop:579 length:369 start_codon:yes stop_codon:yes gene_type:complete
MLVNFKEEADKDQRIVQQIQKIKDAKRELVEVKEIMEQKKHNLFNHKAKLKQLELGRQEALDEVPDDSKDVRKRYRGKEQKSVNKLIMHSGVDKVQKFFDDGPYQFDALIKRLAELEKEEEK